MGNYVGVVVGFIPFRIASALIPHESIPMLVWLLYVSSGVSSDLRNGIALRLRISVSLSCRSVMEFHICGSV